MMSHSRVFLLLSVTVLVLAPLVSTLPLVFSPRAEAPQSEVHSIIKERKEILEMVTNEEVDLQDAPQFVDNMTLPFGGFIQNLGQLADDTIRFYYSTGGCSIGFSDSRIEFSATGPDDESVRFSISFPGSHYIAPVGSEKKVHVVNYIRSDSQFSGISTFDEILYPDLYDGIDLRYYMSERGLKYEFIVKPGADPADIRMAVSDSISLEIDDSSVTFHSGLQALFQDTGLYVFQEDGSTVDTTFEMKQDHPNIYGFSIDPYDTDQTLIIDPWFIAFSTFVAATCDKIQGGAVDNVGNSYVVGYWWVDFWPDNIYDLYAGKFSEDGDMIYSTYWHLGSDHEAFGQDVAIDGDGNAVICGYTDVVTFPTTPDANDSSYNGGRFDAFVARLNDTGAMNYSTFLGGDDYDYAYGIDVDPVTGEIYVVGTTYSTDFPMENALYDSLGGESDIFVVKYEADGSEFVYSTFLGGSGKESAADVVIDLNDYCYVVGSTNSSDYPTSANALNSTFGGGDRDAFLTILDPDGQGLNQSTYIGGAEFDWASGIDVRANGRCYLTGYTGGADFPLVSQLYNHQGGYDAFLTVVNSPHNAFVMSTMLGGSDNDYGNRIVVGLDSKVYICGGTYGSDFPMVEPENATHGGSRDGFIVRINAALDTIMFSTFLGGASVDYINDICLDGASRIYAMGYTHAQGFPLVRAYRSSSYTEEGFITKYVFDDTDPVITLNSPSEGSVYSGETIDLSVTEDWFLDTILYNWDGGPNYTLNAPYDIIVPSMATDWLYVYANDSAGNTDSQTYQFHRTTAWLPFSTYLGGSAFDAALGLTLDDDGNCYVVGYTESANFPWVNPYNDTHGGNSDIFLSKFSADGSLLYSTYIGSPEIDRAYDVALDSMGNILICGFTYGDTGFPLINAENATFGGGLYDAFLMKMNSAGSALLFSTYLGGELSESAIAMTLDDADNIYVVGGTDSEQFPTVNAYNDTKGPSSDAFLTKYSSTGQTILYSTFLGGDGIDQIRDIDIDAEGYCYLVGQTQSTNFPTENALNDSRNGLIDMFITKMRPGDPGLNYSTYWGAMFWSQATSVVVDDIGTCYITGWSDTTGIPLKNEIQTYQGGRDIVVAGFSPSGDSVLFSTYIGGPADDEGWGIDLGPDGQLYVGGALKQSGMPMVNAYDVTFAGPSGDPDAVVLKFNLAGDALEFSTYLGGLEYDAGTDLKVHNDETVYICGSTYSLGYPTVNEYQSGGGGRDACVTRIVIDEHAPTITMESPVDNSIEVAGITVDLDVQDNGSGIKQVLYNWDLNANQTLSSPYLTSLPGGEGLHSLYVYAEDNVGHWVFEYFKLYADEFAPEVELVSPLNDTVHLSTALIDVDVNDTYLDTVMHAWDGEVLSEWAAPYHTSPPASDGEHVLLVVANDSAGRETQVTYVFTTDDSTPTIGLMDLLNNTAIQPGATVALNVTDPHLDTVLYRWGFMSNNETYSPPSEPWAPSGEVEYELHVYANDTLGHSGYARFVFMGDDTSPSLDSPADVTYNLGATGNSITWTASDLHPGTYIVYRGGIEVETGSWTSTIVVDVDGLGVGSYNYEIVVADEAGNTASDQVVVTVEAATTTPTEPPGGVDIVVIVIIAAVGGVILVIMVYICKKKGAGGESE